MARPAVLGGAHAAAARGPLADARRSGVDPSPGTGATPAEATPAEATPAGATPVGATPVEATPTGATPAGASPTGAGGCYPWQARLGAVPEGDATSFRVWAPGSAAVAVEHSRGKLALEHAGLGIWVGRGEVRAGADYWYVLEPSGGGPRERLADPCSRHQPGGLRGPSRVFDAHAHAWADGSFLRAPLRESVLYELHVGTFTSAGTFDAAAQELGRLRELGVTAVELMPVAEGPGERGWGYDGVYISAAHHAYGGPTGLAALRRGRARARAGGHPRRRLQPPRGLGHARYGELRPVLHRSLQHCLGQGDQLRRPRERSRARMGPAERRRMGRGLPRRRSAAGRDPRDLRPGREADRRGARRARPRRAPRDPRDRRVRPERPAGHPPDRAGRLRLRRAVGRRLPPRSAELSWRGIATATTSTSAASRTSPRPTGVRSCTTASTRASAAGASAPKPATDRREQFVVFSQNHDQVGNRAFGDRLPAAAQPPGGVLRAALPLHADALHGRGVRRAGPVPVLHRSHRRRASRGPRARAAAASSKPLRPSARRCPTRRIRPPSRRPS